jgi:competence ComEA-like helix-hairpin-helix protein
MTKSPFLSAPANSIVLATLGSSYGYRFNADSVELTASFRIHTPVAHQRQWSLQLWACATAPARPAELQGQLVASTSLPPLAEIADPVETFTVNTTAILPVGQRDYALVLALVATTADHRTAGEVHDLAVYPRRETFALPRLVDGKIASLADGHAVITARSIENPRDPSNISGSLSLELWAMDQTYSGGDFRGSPVAGVVLGSLAGQCNWTGLDFHLTATLPTKNACLVLMLREWNGTTYITRDYVNLAEPFIVPAIKAKPAAAQPVTVASAPVAIVTATPAIKPAKSARKSGSSKKVSVNTATETELATVKGFSRPIAQAIVANRPFAKINDLIKVKGLGPKLLDKARSHLRLN